jgi:hypothetical protein
MDTFPRTVYTVALSVTAKVIESDAFHKEGIQRIAADYLQHIGEEGIYDQDEQDILDLEDGDTIKRIIQVVKQNLKNADFEAACWREYADRLLKQVSQLEAFAHARKEKSQ